MRNDVISTYGFRLPTDYLRFLDGGLLSNDLSSGMRVSRHRWMVPAEIESCELPSYTIKSLLPCARTPGRDYYCWSMTGSEAGWIAECPRDSDFAGWFAPHFEGFVFRSLLEEFNDTWLTVNLNEAGKMFAENARHASNALRPNWSHILGSFAARPPMLNRGKKPQVISDAELANIIGSELAFPMLGESFQQNVD